MVNIVLFKNEACNCKPYISQVKGVGLSIHYLENIIILYACGPSVEYLFSERELHGKTEFHCMKLKAKRYRLKLGFAFLFILNLTLIYPVLCLITSL